MGRFRHPFPRSRLPLHRRPFADPAALRRWLLVVVLATATAGLTARTVRAAEARQARWGRTRTVLVVDRTVAAGAPLTGVVVPARWPVALVPPAAVRTVPPAGRAAGPLAEGSVLTSTAIAAGPGPAGGQRIAVPVAAARLPLRAGDRVDVWATIDPAVSGTAVATRRVARGATVTRAGTRSVVVAVAPDEVPAVAEAAALATVTLVATG